MKKITISVLLVFFFMNLGYSQASAYSFANSSGTYTETSASATTLAAVRADSYISPAQNIGFTFVYENVSYNQFTMSSNGVIALGASNTSVLTTNDFSAANLGSRPIIAPLWDDLDGATPASSTARYEVTGTSPNRVLTVEWRNWEWNWNSGAIPVISFQVKLYETTNVIQFVYRQESGAVASGTASIGIGSAFGSGAGSFLNLTDVATPAVSNTTSTTNISTKPATGQIYTFTPPLCGAPSSIVTSPITAAGATINWTNGGSETSWESYTLLSSVPPPTAASNTGTVVTTKPLVVTGLNQLTAYTTYVRAACSASSTSFWTASSSFTTLATCPPPTAMSITAITTSGASATWVNGGGETQWEYYLLPSSATPPTAASNTGTLITTKPLLLTGLTQLTSYRLYVRARCSASDLSTWLSSSMFTTLATCPVPTAMVISAVGPTVATANWTNGGAETQWEYYLLPSAATAPTAASNTGTLTSTKPVNLSGLTPATGYRFYVRAYCSPTDSSTSWLASTTFTTLVACPAPTAMVISALAPTSASATWTNGFSETQWEYYVLPSTTAPPAATSNTGTVVTLKPISLTGLIPSTTYKLYVRAACSASSTSAWLASANFTTPCLPTTLPYLQDFESVTVPALPACTLSVNEGSGNSWATSSNPGSGFTTKALSYNYSFSSPANAWFFTQGISLTAGQSIDVRFKYGNNATIYTEKLAVAFGTSPAGAAMINPVVNFPNINTSTLQSAFATVTVPTTGVYYFGFNVYSIANQFNLFVDDIRIEVTPTCPAPTALNANTITNTTATVSFTEPTVPPALGYQYFLSTSPTAPIATTTPTGTVLAGLNSKDLTGLTPATTYYAWVRGRCSASDIGPWSIDPAIFLTNCNNVTTFGQNFDAATTFPTCWKKLGALGTAGIITTGASSTPNCLSMFSGTAATRAVVAMPPVSNIATGTHRLRFQARAASTVGGVIEVGYLNDYFDDATFVPVKTVTTTSTTVYDGFNVELGTTPLPGTFLAFRHSGVPANTVYIDNVFWEPIPTCPEPTAPIASSITATTVNISFVESIPPAAAGYQYFVSATSTAPLASATPTGTVAAGISSFAATGLTPATTYYVYVRSNCGAGSLSPWSNNVSFNTLCSAVTTFTQNFDTTLTTTFPICWAKVGTPGSANLQSTGALSASNCLYIYGFSNTTRAVVSMPPVSNAGANTHWLKFRARGNFSTGGILEVGYLTNPFDDATFVPLQNFTTTSITVYDSFTANLGTAPGANQVLAFRHTGTPGNSILIDDVSWEPQPSCNFPANIVASNILPTSATVSWTAPGVPPTNGYQYFLSTSSTPPTATSTPTGSTAAGVTVVSLTGLISSTNYYISVRSVCSASTTSSWSGVVAFATPCVPVSTLPWNEGFEGVTTPGTTAFPPCWVKENGDWSTSNATTYNTPRTGANYLRDGWNATNEYMWTPGFQLTAGTSYDFTFYAQGDGWTSWTAGIFQNTSPTSASATQLGANYVPTGPGSTAIQPYTLVKRTFVPTTSGVYYFGLNVNEATGSPWYLAFDDFRLEVTPTCSGPTGVSAMTTSSSTANVSWTAPSTAPANGYQYFVSTSSVTPLATVTPTGSVAAGITSASITGLAVSQSYNVWVRSVCGVGNVSSWSVPATFNTLIVPGCVTAIAPASGAINVTPGIVTLSWTAPTMGDPTASYDVYFSPIAASLTASGALLGNYTSTSTTVNITGFSTTYYWRVAPKNAGGTNIGCATFSFTTAANPGYCLVSEFGLYPSATFTPSSCSGTTAESITTAAYCSEYSNVSVIAGQGYKFDSSVATDFVTIGNAAGTTALAFGTGSVSWQSTLTGVIRFYTHTDTSCGSSTTSRTRSVTCGVLSNNAFNNSAFSYYPNPVTDVLNLSYNQTITKVSVYNLLGQEVIAKSINTNIGQVDMSNLANGTYVVRVTADNQTKTIKVLKQ